MAKRSIRKLTSRPPPAQVQNLLLAALPRIDRDRLVPTLDVVSLKLKDILHKPGERIQHVYFPGGGFCSVLTALEDGTMVEVATIGREGVVGVAAMLGTTPESSVSMVQGETDTCYRMTADALRREVDQRGAFAELLTHFAKALMGFVMQSTACNAVHTVEQRLARWLLMARDRMGTDDFPLTQEFVAMMLGASRPTVTLVAGALQKAGLIKYHRGRVTVLDGRRLEATSCECYRTATNLLLGVTSRRG
ncbi:MAG: Crp/Fnr family transcriptional regulator [Vicinamibacterales bacterium]